MRGWYSGATWPEGRGWRHCYSRGFWIVGLLWEVWSGSPDYHPWHPRHKPWWWHIHSHRWSPGVAWWRSWCTMHTWRIWRNIIFLYYHRVSTMIKHTQISPHTKALFIKISTPEPRAGGWGIFKSTSTEGHHRYVTGRSRNFSAVR